MFKFAWLVTENEPRGVCNSPCAGFSWFYDACEYAKAKSLEIKDRKHYVYDNESDALGYTYLNGEMFA